MGDIPVPVPPLAEQERIEVETEAATRQADDLRLKLERQVELLLERRQALAIGALTGQVETSGVAA